MNAAIVFSRLDSQRLPNKALMKLGRKRVIDWVIDSLKELKNVEIILATSDRTVDDPLEVIAKEKNINVYRGDFINVAKRTVDCIKKYGICNFARVNADSPFVRAELLMEGFNEIQNYDMVTNLYPRTYPYGISVEIFKSKFYLNEYKLFKNERYCEHMTLYLYENISKYIFYNIHNKEGICHDVYLTVDVQNDLFFLNKMLNKDCKIFEKSIQDIVMLYRRMKGEHD